MDVGEAVRRVGAHQHGLATRRQLIEAGLRPKQLPAAVETGALVRVRRGVYGVEPLRPAAAHLLSGGQVDEGYVAQVQAVLLALRGRTAASRRTAAVLWGFDLPVEPSMVEVDACTDSSRISLAGVDVRRQEHVTSVLSPQGLVVTPPIDTVMACAASLPLAEGVAVADSALRAGRVTMQELRRAVAVRGCAPGGRKLARTIRLADPRAGSVLESMLRTLLAIHGLLPPCTQYEIRRQDGTLVGRVDMCWPELRLVVEADGRRWHDPVDARDRDRRRANDLEVLGWGLLRFSWADVVGRPQQVVETVRAALARRRAA